MPNAQELKVARRVAARSLKELSSSLRGPPPVGLPALLRRCFRILPYLDAGDQRQARRCRLLLFDALRNVLSRDPSPSLLPAIEVFAENLVCHSCLRSFFVMVDCAAPEDSRVFTGPPLFLSSFQTILELICNHFISALENEGGFRAFLSALSGSGNEMQGAPEISFQWAYTLFFRTQSFSLPSLVRAHLLLLASRCINGPDLSSHLSAFEKFVVLYVDSLPALGVFNKNGSVKKPQSPGKRPLTCCIKGVTHHRLENHVNGLLSFSPEHMGDDLPISDSDIYDISDRLIKQNQHMIDGKFRQKVTTAVRSILSNVLHCAKRNEVHESDAQITEEIFCLAAVLRLMGSLLQQILHQFSQMRAAGGKENANRAALCSDFSMLYDTIHLLSHYEANALHRCDFIGTIGQPADRERASIQMLAHFSSLSVFCVRRRLGFLWRICITMMMLAMNLVIVEEESMCILELLIGVSKESAAKAVNLQMQVYTTAKAGNLQVYTRRSTKAIALQWEAIQNRSTEKTNGRACLQSHPQYNKSWDDLEDFIVCEKGKDYSKYFERTKKFMAFKVQKFISKKKSRKNKRREEMLGLHLC